MSLYVLGHSFLPRKQSETLAGKHSLKMRCCFFHLREKLSSYRGDSKSIFYGNTNNEKDTVKDLVESS